MKAATVFQDMTASDLAGLAAGELMIRTGLDPKEIDASIFGVVIPDVSAPNLAREVVFRTGLPRAIEAWTVNRACASSNQAITSGADLISQGLADVVLAGGGEAMSAAPILWSKRISKALMKLQKARGVGGTLGAFRGVKVRDFLPVPPAIAESFTGLTMGESCEKMARENGIGRREQDELALRSHQRAAAAWQDGRLKRDVVPVFPPPRYDAYIDSDTMVRSDTDMESLSKLRPAFDRKWGSLTPGNSSPLTDGASAVLLMGEDKAKALGLAPMGFLRSYAFSALDPFDQLLQGPAYAIPKALERAGATLADMDLVEMHEAFAAQVLSNLQALGSEKFAREKLGRSKPVGEVDPERLNVMGGSIAIGHPFGATGARLCTQLLREMNRRGSQLGMVSVCAAGGIGSAMIWERE